MTPVLTSENVAHELGPANASALAQQFGGGVGIQNVRRGVGKATLGPSGSNITVSGTSYGALNPALALTMSLSGRPVRVTLAGMFAAGASGTLALDVLLRGTSITGVGNGLIYTATTVALALHGEEIVMAPSPGRATFEVVAKRATADATVYMGADERLALTVVEL